MPRGIGSELCVSTPCAEPVRGTLSGLYLSRDVRLGSIAMPRGIGWELCGFAPCAEPVCGTLLGSADMGVLGARPLFRMTMPRGIGSELCVFTPWAEPVTGTKGTSEADVGFGEPGWAQPLMARMENAIMACPDTRRPRTRILNSLLCRKHRSIEIGAVPSFFKDSRFRRPAMRIDINAHARPVRNTTRWHRRAGSEST